MTIRNLFILLFFATGTLFITSCWTDLDKYDEFVCERFGGDADGDGVCSRFDCNDRNADIYEGAPCDDGIDSTIMDMIDVDCICTGTVE